MKSLIALFSALAQGHQLKNSREWKTGGAALSALTAILSAIVGVGVAFGVIPRGVISIEVVSSVSAAIVAIVGSVMSYLSIATSKTVGLKKDRNDPA